MRTTYINDLRLERKIPYDPDFHGLILKEFDFEVALTSADDTSGVFNVRVQVIFRIQDTKEEMGRIEAKAESRISGVQIPRSKDGTFDPLEAPEALRRLVEGAVGEDVIVPLSVLARAARMPTIFPIPILFPRPEHKHTKARQPRKSK